MKMFLVSFIVGLMLGSPEAEFERRHMMKCSDVVVESGAAALDCQRFMSAIERAMQLYEARLGGTKKVKASAFKFVKKAPVNRDVWGHPVFTMQGVTGEFYGMFDSREMIIYFTMEATVTHEMLHAVDFYKHPKLERKKQFIGLAEDGSLELYRWQIVLHDTPDDPFREVQ